MADTIPVSAQTTTPQLYGGAYGQVWWCRGPQPVSFQLNGSSYTAQVKSGLITSPYASVDDVFTISVAQDQTFDYNPAVVGTWLRIGAAKINEWLGQRFLVPLTVWSDTVVWANCELAYIGMTRQRGINSEALMADFRAREESVMSWLKMSRDHEITADQRLSVQDQPIQALQYYSQPGRGWDVGSGGLAGWGWNAAGAIGRTGGRGIR